MRREDSRGFAESGSPAGVWPRQATGRPLCALMPVQTSTAIIVDRRDVGPRTHPAPWRPEGSVRLVMAAEAISVPLLFLRARPVGQRVECCAGMAASRGPDGTSADIAPNRSGVVASADVPAVQADRVHVESAIRQRDNASQITTIRLRSLGGDSEEASIRRAYARRDDQRSRRPIGFDSAGFAAHHRPRCCVNNLSMSSRVRLPSRPSATNCSLSAHVLYPGWAPTTPCHSSAPPMSGAKVEQPARLIDAVDLLR